MSKKSGYQIVPQHSPLSSASPGPIELSCGKNDNTSKTDSSANLMNHGKVEIANNNETIGINIKKRLSSFRDIENLRTVSKSGKFNTSYRNETKVGSSRSSSFLGDLFTSLCDMNWGGLLLIFCLVYFGSWTAFAIIWYALLYFHGDFDNFGDPGWRPCISDIKGFTESFLFSVETQHTTGYGFYKLGDECSSTIITFCLQSIVGCILEGLMVGFVFAKISRGKGRKANIIFSENGAITLDQPTKKLRLLFRVADLCKKSNLIHATVRAQLIRKTGESTLTRQELKLIGEGEESNEILLFWPTILVHEIDSSSPLHNEFRLCSQKEQIICNSNENWEIILVLQGVIESTGQLTQARTSYLKSEIVLGHSFYEICRIASSKPPHCFAGYTSSLTSMSPTSMMKIDYGNFNQLKPDKVV